MKEERIARAATAEVAIVAIQKMEERLAADTEENIDNQLLGSHYRVIGNLRRRADGRNDVESSVQEENLERRFRLAALRSERAGTLPPARHAGDQQRNAAKITARSRFA